MPKSDAVWGIDIGQCALKALRCRPHADATQVVADGFDYVEYPQILSQPGADAAELIRDALKTFLSRNSVKGDRIAISVPGQNGLARFIKLPPVEAKKIPDIVRYEAKQQIPFDLSEVIWDYQRMGGGSEQEGFALETEIGLFAMKREQVVHALQPFVDADMDVDIVQLTPLALYNYIRFDQMVDLPSADEYDPENPPPSVVILSLGTDASDLVVTNGFRVWQRSVPVGGNHFTRALTKEMKLTFPKAEHLKRNATSAQDPKAVFQAMRPVFNDLLTEVQRSIGYFQSIDRAAQIERIYALGSAMKLPGLRKYIEQNLGIEVVKVEAFRGLNGASVVANPAFQENLGCFGVCYGLAVQGLGRGGLSTNLVPHEHVRDRVFREKKPWVVGMVALVLLAFAISYASFARGLSTVDAKLFDAAERKAASVAQSSGDIKGKVDAERTKFTQAAHRGEALVGNIEGRYLWLEMLKAVNACLPVNRSAPKPTASGEPVYQPIEDRDELHVSSLEAAWVENVRDWYTKVYKPASAGKHVDFTGRSARSEEMGGGGPEGDAAQQPPAGGEEQGGDAKDVPEGPGYIITVKGRHYHNYAEAGKLQGAQYVKDKFIKLIQGSKTAIELPVRDGKPTNFSPKELGIRLPVLVNPEPIRKEIVENPNVEGTAPRSGASAKPNPENVPGRAPKTVEVRVFDFMVQMIWQPTPVSKRVESRQKAQQASAESAPVQP
jgi:type IV pilus assembly protein PilM